MASQNTSSGETDAEEVNDFLQRIKELGQRRDSEDDERNRKLEEEILQGRKERQYRREERARSISPTKSSPANTPPHNPYRRSIIAGDSSRIQSKNEDFMISPSHKITLDDAAEPSIDIPPSTTENEPEVPTLESITMQKKDSNPNSPSTIPTRELSWQRRPKSQGSDRPRSSRPLSQVATENASAARSPIASPNRSPADDDTFSRDQIANSLGSKDPAFFRQTADRGASSAAYRKNQVEDTEVADHRVGAQLPGMSRLDAERNNGAESREISPVRSGRSKTMSSGVFAFDGARGSGARSPMPVSPAQRFDPPGSDTTSTSDRTDLSAVRERSLAMSPTQGRMSPEKADRPHSPTKGMGGFVQSAMMKRSDSVNKRWSVQQPGLSRTSSTSPSRSSYHPSTSSAGFGELLKSPPIREPTPLSRDHTPRPSSRPSSRPTSSYGGSNATVIQHEIERSETPGSVKISEGAIDGFVKPTQPATRSIPDSTASSREDLPLKNEGARLKETVLPASPSRTMDPKRWSPTKASWLESALNKPESSPKPRTVAAPSQPSWMAEIAKARQKSVDSVASRNQAPKHEVNIGGLMRSPAMGVTTKPMSLGGLPKGFNPAALRNPEPIGKGVLAPNKTGSGLAGQNDGRASPRPLSPSSRAERPTSSSSMKSTPGTGVGSPALQSPGLNKSPSPVLGKVKPETPPKNDFRSNLKPRQPPPQSTGKNEVEFKNVFGQLKKAQTKNYVAPDELKDNIMRGKSALNITGGPKKTERVDEFRQSLLQRKKEFEKAQLEGKGVARTSSNASKEDFIPEAIARRKTLVREEKDKFTPPSTPPKPMAVGVTERSMPEGLDKAKPMPEGLKEAKAVPADAPKPPAPLPKKQASAPGRMPAGGKLADRFNPALAGLLARGPPSASNESSRASSPSSQRSLSMGTSADTEVNKPAPKLEHVTKGRARGPRRKAPSSLRNTHESEKEVEKTEPAETAVTAKTTETSNTAQDPVNVHATVEPETSKQATETMPAKVEETAPETVTPASQPTSPRKRTMTINRRSRFLEELANKNDKVPEPTALKSPIKKLNIEGIFQAPVSPTKEPAKSPVGKLNHEFLPKSPTKSPIKDSIKSPLKSPIKSLSKDTPELKNQAEVPAEVKINPISTSSTTTMKERPVAPPKKSPALTKNALEDTVKMNAESESLASTLDAQTAIDNHAVSENPTPLRNNRSPVDNETSAKSIQPLDGNQSPVSAPLQMQIPDPIQKPTSLRSLPSPPAPVPISEPIPAKKVDNIKSPASARSPLSPSARFNMPKPFEAKSLDVQAPAVTRPLPSPSAPTTLPSFQDKKPDVPQKPAGSRPLPSPKPTTVESSQALKSPSARSTRILSPTNLQSFQEEKPDIPQKPASARPLPSPSAPTAAQSVQKEKPELPQKTASTRALPNIPAPITIVPLKNPLSPPTTSNEVGRKSTPMSSASPSKKGFPSIPHSTEASRLLRDFFGEPTSPPPGYEIDTAAILLDNPSSQIPKVNTISCQLYQLAAGGKKTAIPLSLETTLFEGNLYICVHNYKNASNSKVTEVYFWIGDEVPDSLVQDSEIFASREAKSAGGKLTLQYQGRESAVFFQALGGVAIIRRGSSTKYDSLAPYILCGRQYLGSLVFDEIPCDFSSSCLCSGFPYIINSPNAKIWLWKGKGSSPDEIDNARVLGLELGIMGFGEADEGKEPDDFLALFGVSRIRGGAGHWALKPKYPGYGGRLFKIEVAKVTEVSPFTQTSISPHNIYVLDAFFEIYIIVGAYSGAVYPGASATAYGGGASSSSYSGNGGNQGNQYQAFHTALHFAQEYGILAAGMEDRPFVPVSNVVVDGMPRDARIVVRKWREDVVTTRNDAAKAMANGSASSSAITSPSSAGNGLQRGRSLRVVPLMAALEATRG